ncbi:hypothetical protein RMN57_20475 [Kitasatospora sp. CM 4170]|uniref:Gram-positive cocci surface proteins LPxTG domain-containing protein n=1 Tax=Kitasatospora aburaviensis TaxID=67265 RepID=A0ABW1F6D1_9ACTN|nr:hypothetical protein [Kitasatospora sp. CM 4170]WNM46902.1 hypothetical protein RMN57_20475 [Kitasatospora sp. CM 4170]
MRLRHALLAATLVASPLVLALPAQAAGSDAEPGVQIDGFSTVEAGGGWSEGTVTVRNDADAAVTGQHLVLYFGSRMLGLDQVAAEYADGAAGTWQPVKLVDQDLGAKPGGHQGVAADLTGAEVELQPHSVHTFKLRFKLLQSAHTGPEIDVSLDAYLAPTFGRDGLARDWTAQASKQVGTTGLTTAVNGLPGSVPADGKAHPFTVSIKTANKFDWHLDRALFFLWAGQGVGSTEGPAACDAQLELQDPKDGSWHQVGLAARGLEGRDVDLARYGTGPVDNRVINARLTLGANFKTSADARLGFGQFPGAGPVLFWAEQKLAATAVAGAPACVDPNAPAPKPTATTPAPTAPAPATAAPSVAPAAAVTASPTATASAAPRAATGNAGTTGRTELADTGAPDVTVPTVLGAGLLAVGAAAITVARRARRS